jgi:lipopolysaccharide/colanic/teichoic acid biosynthesis glycosyltransferase
MNSDTSRIFDIIFAILAIIILTPLLLPIMILLRFSGEKEVFYLQERVGLDQKTFRLIKFATMKKNSPYIGTGTTTLKDDPRVLPLGHILRRTKINELPQILNVLIGDMSLIGPRPLTPDKFILYSEKGQSELSSIRPGLSGIGSIVFRNEDQLFTEDTDHEEFYSKVIAPYKEELETWYIKNRSLHNYFKLIIITIFAVIRPKTTLLTKWLRGVPTRSL